MAGPVNFKYSCILCKTLEVFWHVTLIKNNYYYYYCFDSKEQKAKAYSLLFFSVPSHCYPPQKTISSGPRTVSTSIAQFGLDHQVNLL